MKKAMLVGVVIWTPNRTVSVRAVDGATKIGTAVTGGRFYGTASYYVDSVGVLSKYFTAECNMSISGIDYGYWKASTERDYDVDAYDFFIRTAPRELT